MRKSKRHIQVKPTFAFVVEGQTEMWYLQMLKRNESLSINIEPKLYQKRNIEAQYNQVMELANNSIYDKVFWIIDLDVILKQNRDSKGNKVLNELINYINNLQKISKNVQVIINNPCLEIWFLLHYEYTTKEFNKCDEVANHLKKHLKNYQKDEKYFTKEGNDIYLKHKDKLQDAITNTQKLGRFDENNPTKTICEMFLIFQEKEFKKLINPLSHKNEYDKK